MTTNSSLLTSFKNWLSSIRYVQFIRWVAINTITCAIALMCIFLSTKHNILRETLSLTVGLLIIGAGQDIFFLNTLRIPFGIWSIATASMGGISWKLIDYTIPTLLNAYELAIGSIPTFAVALLVGMIIGINVGAVQMLFLRSQIRQGCRWLVASVSGFGFGLLGVHIFLSYDLWSYLPSFIVGLPTASSYFFDGSILGLIYSLVTFKVVQEILNY